MFHPYPPALPIEEGKYLAPLLRGKAPDDIAKAAHAGWALQGYAQSVLIPDSQPSVGVLSEGQVADHLETLGSPTVAAAMPWDLILPILLQFLLDLTKKKA